ncbi:MAG: HAD family hydrolase [Bacteroidota bacterium]
MNKNAAVIFDMDGVLVDNKHIHRKAWVDFCQKHNHPIKEEDFDRIGFGKTNKEYLSFFFQREIPENEAIKLGEEKERIYRDIIEQDIDPVNGLIPLLQKIKKQYGFKTAVASSAPRTNIDFIMEKLKINDYFDVLVDESMVHEGKPNPDIYVKAAQLLEVIPEHTLVFEDSLFGVEAALRAGMIVVALTTSHNKKELSEFSVWKIIKDFSEIGADEIKTILSQTNGCQKNPS